MSKFKAGDKVRFIGEGLHKHSPQYYPKVGTIGTVKACDAIEVMVQWPIGSTSVDDMWRCEAESLELVEETPDMEQQDEAYLTLKREFDHLRKKTESLKSELAEEKSKVDYLEGKVEAYRWCIDKIMGGVCND